MTANLPQFHYELGGPTKLYPYRDKSGETIAAIYRFDQKDGKEIRPYDLKTGKWAMPATRPLYGLDDLSAHPNKPVVLVEGEKCADALLKAGFLATTVMGGANAVYVTDWPPLKGRRVIIWPDHDEAGLKYAHDASLKLKEIGADVSILSLKEIDWDVVLKHPDTTSDLSETDLRNFMLRVPPLRGEENPPLLKERNLRYELKKGWDAADALKDGFSAAHIVTLLKKGVPPEPESTPLKAANDNLSLSPDNWDEPDRSFLKSETPPPDFPVNLFPTPIADWLLRTAESKSAPVDYVAGSLLTAAASLIGNARRISPWEGWTETPILWSALVGSPSAGKSPAMDPVLSLMRDLEGDYQEDHLEALRNFETDKMEAELLKAKWQSECKDATAKGFAPPLMPEKAIEPDTPTQKRLLIRDATIEATAMALKGQPKGLMSYRDELAGWFANFDRYSGAKGGDRAFWLEAYGARAYTVDRIKNGGEPLMIPSLSCSILGGIQPDKLETCLMGGADDGLSARFLYFYPNPVKRQRPRFTPDGKMLESVLRRLESLSVPADSHTPKRRTAGLSASAADCFDAWWQALPDREPAGRMAGWWGKLPGTALRLALVMEYLNWASEGNTQEPVEVAHGTISAALTLIDEYFAPMAERAFGLHASNEVSPATLKLADYLENSGPNEFTVRDLCRSGPLRSLKAPEVKTACLELVRYGWLRPAPIRAGETSGKTQSRFLANPAL